MSGSQWLRPATIVLCATLSSGASAASTDQFPPCGSFSLIGGLFKNSVLDFEKKSDSVGDERIGQRELKDSGGTIVGMARWLTTVVDTGAGDGNDTLTLADDIFFLPDGTIHAEGVLLYRAILKPETQPDSTPTETPMAVLGGTGAYVKSDGEVEIIFPRNGPAEYIFKLFCP